MGQANKRGTLDERKAQAIARNQSMLASQQNLLNVHQKHNIKPSSVVLAALASYYIRKAKV